MNDDGGGHCQTVKQLVWGHNIKGFRFFISFSANKHFRRLKGMNRLSALSAILYHLFSPEARNNWSIPTIPLVVLLCTP